MTTNTIKVGQEIEAFKRKLLDERLAQVTEPQRQLFARIFAGGVPADKLESAIDLCDRTIQKNLADPSRLETKP